MKDALRQAGFNHEDDTITLRSGVYEGSFEIFDKNGTTLTIQGEPSAERDAIIIDGGSQYEPLLVNASDDAKIGRVTLKNLTVTGSSDSGITVSVSEGGIDALAFENVVVTANQDNGLYVTAFPKEAALSVTDSLFSDNRYNGLSYRGYYADAVIENSRFTGNLEHGAYFSMGYAPSILQIVDSDFYNNAKDGAYVYARSLQVENCRAYQNGENGLKASGEGTIENLESFSNGAYGLDAIGMNISHSTMHANTYGVKTYSKTVFDKNSVYDNDIGIEVYGYTSLSNNLIRNNEEGIRYSGNAYLLMAYNTVVDNAAGFFFPTGGYADRLYTIIVNNYFDNAVDLHLAKEAIGSESKTHLYHNRYRTMEIADLNFAFEDVTGNVVDGESTLNEEYTLPEDSPLIGAGYDTDHGAFSALVSEWFPYAQMQLDVLQDLRVDMADTDRYQTQAKDLGAFHHGSEYKDPRYAEGVEAGKAYCQASPEACAITAASIWTETGDVDAIRSMTADKTHVLDGHYLHYDSDPFDWLYIAADGQYVGKLEEGCSADGSLRWSTIHTSKNPGFETVILSDDGRSVQFGAME